MTAANSGASAATADPTARTISRPVTPLPAAVRIECLIAAGLALTNVAEQGGDNRGQMVELFLRGVGLPPGTPWCAAFVHHVGYWSQLQSERSTSAWPLPATGSCQMLSDFAAQRNVLVAPGAATYSYCTSPHLAGSPTPASC